MATRFYRLTDDYVLGVAKIISSIFLAEQPFWCICFSDDNGVANQEANRFFSREFGIAKFQKALLSVPQSEARLCQLRGTNIADGRSDDACEKCRGHDGQKMPDEA